MSCERSDGQRVRGVIRAVDDARVVLVAFDKVLTDRELRSIHEYLRGWTPGKRETEE